MPFALDGTSGRTVIESRGIAHTIDFTIDHIHRVPQVSIHQSSLICTKRCVFHAALDGFT